MIKKKSKKWLAYGMFLLSFFMLFGCTPEGQDATAPQEEANTTDETQELNILFTNDFHAQIDPMVATWEDDEALMGGFAEFSAYINKIRDEEENVIYVDVGDFITGPPISTLTEGEAIVDLLNHLEVDAAVYGNHEFDHGTEQAASFMDLAEFPLLGANIFYKDSGEQFAKPYEILDVNGIKVGVIGILGKKAGEDTIFSENISNIEFKEQIPVLQQYVDEIKSEVDIIVALGHQGQAAQQGVEVDNIDVEERFAKDVEVINAVEGIDVLISGHAHLPIETPYVAEKTGTILVSSRGLGVEVGHLTLTLADGEIVDHRGHLEKIYSDEITPDSTIQKRVDYWNKEVEEITGEVISTTPERLSRTYEDDNILGILTADAMRHVTGADIAFQHPGGLRADIEAGEVTVGDVIAVLPFPSPIYTKDLKGTDVLEILEQSAAMNYGILSPSGITMTVDTSQPVGSRVVSAQHEGEEIDPEGTYKVAADAFIVLGGDEFYGFLNGENLETSGLTSSDAVVDYLKDIDVIETDIEDRVIIK